MGLRGDKMIVLHFPFRCISKDNERIQNKQGRYFVSSKFREFESKIQIYTKNQIQGTKLLEGDLEIYLKVYFKNKVHSDATNLFKGVCDALNNIIWNDDRQIKKATVEIFYWTEDAFRILIQERETVKEPKSKTP